MTEGQLPRRQEFLIQWYAILWSNIDRSMRGIWNVLGTVTLMGTVLVAVHKDYLPYSAGILLGLLLVFWGVNVTIDLNGWHRRNLFMLTAIEREFLDSTDYGRILPEAYRRPEESWVRFYRLNVTVFILLGLAFCGYALVREAAGPTPTGVWSVWILPIHWIALAIGVVLTVMNLLGRAHSAKKHWQELFGSSRDGESKIEAPKGRTDETRA